jgi:GPH family glycoside/pentoside/hexuronide:cation symporter
MTQKVDLSNVEVKGNAPESVVAADRIPFWTKMSYGAGDVGAAIVSQVSGFFLTTFLLDVAGLLPALASAMLLIVNIWDAVIDLPLGNLSDNTRSRFGRRRSWLLFGAVPFGIAFILMWVVPPIGNQWGKFAYYLLVAMGLRLTFSIVNIAYTAMTPEMTPDYNERTRLNTFRFTFSVLGGVTAVVIYQQITALFEDKALGSLVAAVGLGLAIMISSLIPFFGTREQAMHEHAPDDDLGMWGGVRMAFNNRPFILVVLIFLLSWVTVQFVQSNLFAYMRYWFRDESLFTGFVIILQLIAVAFFPVWSWVSTRFGKRYTYFAGAAVMALTLSYTFFLQPGNTFVLYTIAFFAGTGVSMILLIPWSMLPDVIEWNELQTGQRHEGVFYSLFVFAQQIGLGLALATSTGILGAVGYISPVDGIIPQQPENVLFTLRLFISFIPVGLLLLSIPLVIAYPITRQKFAEIRAELAERKAK